MNFQEIRVYAEGCLRDTPPPCSCVCPFSIDIRGLAEQVLNGRYERAFRTYRDAVLFPGIVSKLCAAPCGEVCVRAKIFDGKVDLPAIERGIVERASKTEPVRYAVPRKKERIAVVGGGMSGLACTLRLASKGYALTLYEAAEKVGGRVLGLLGQDVTEADVNRAFRYIDYELRLGEEISLAAFDAVCAENDAVYVATGAGGAAFGLLEGRDDRTSSTLRAGVFLGGSLTGTDPAGSIENGIRAASAAEEYLKTGRGGGLGPLFDKAAVDGRFYDLTYRFETPAAGSAAAGSVTGSAAAEELAVELAANTAPEDSAVDACIAEARRCPRCNCSACIDACTLIRHFKQNPKRIAADLGVTVLPVDEKIKHVASRMLNSCNICGLCTAVCPAGVDTCLAMYESRRILLRGGHLPAAYHSFWMDDMAFSMSEEAFAVVLPVPSALPVLSVGSESAGEKGETGRGLLFFPGCQLTASRPDTVSRTYEHIKTIAPNASMLLSCCGVPADWAGEEAIFESTSEKLRAAWEGLGRPEILYACSTCKKTFEKASPMVRGSLVYEWIAENGGGAARLPGDDARLPGGAMRACVYDPCSSRADKAGQAAVRELATRGGFVLDELGPSGETAACCGFGGHIYPANPTLLGEILAERTAASEVPYITYCANCNDLFLSEGKDSRHILDILFPSPSEEGLPSLTQRRENRRALKAKYAGLKEAPRPPALFEVSISPELEKKMDRLLLLREDVERAVAYCEGENAKVVDPVSGYSIGYRQGGAATVWVVYSVTDRAQAVLYNVYSHRMKIEG